jgi:hypothetical protein
MTQKAWFRPIACYSIVGCDASGGFFGGRTERAWFEPGGLLRAGASVLARGGLRRKEIRNGA